MKPSLLILLFTTIILSSCSTKKLTVNTPAAPARQKVLSENTLINRYSGLDYINRYKAIAISEMNKSGIPASITLAQGLLESGNGNSTLAREANNHFGIKCTPEWRGKTVLRDDDKIDDCFRVYSNAEESFRDHSEFLKRKRYASLFELDKNDYQGWAYGLKQAGYATNPKYPELLISLVQRYNLDQYDRRENEKEKIIREDKVLAQIVNNIPQETKENARPAVAMKIYEVKKGDTLYSISRRFSLTIEEIRILNNLQKEDIQLGQLLLVSK
ncbi:glucosaminidase domain-containing protein [Daejeonella oryzae]|uniref:glucosaminidase domain-containing protein n=1 Tax=Daejeonella oryzae TaxID=1122943 RepID=UPI0004094619|nr:glucosaminidase domain-containing protein [Daejeonella oryzae]